MARHAITAGIHSKCRWKKPMRRWDLVPGAGDQEGARQAGWGGRPSPAAGHPSPGGCTVAGMIAQRITGPSIRQACFRFVADGPARQGWDLDQGHQAARSGGAVLLLCSAIQQRKRRCEGSSWPGAESRELSLSVIRWAAAARRIAPPEGSSVLAQAAVLRLREVNPPHAEQGNASLLVSGPLTINAGNAAGRVSEQAYRHSRSSQACTTSTKKALGAH